MKTLAALVVAALASPALAGFTASTTVDTVLTPDTGAPGASVGDTFSMNVAGGFDAFIPDTASDPQITGGDLNFYRYTLNGAVASVLANVVTYTGTYTIFYDLGLDGIGGTDINVSSGSFTLTATFVTGFDALLAGTLTQTSGPANPAFSDLSYGGSPVIYTGTYTGGTPGVSGVIEGTLRQNAVPTPGAMALAGIGGLVAARRRRV